MSPLPRAHGEAVLQARYRVEPEDFQVEEIDGFEPTGAGEHLLLTVEKRGMNTSFAAKRIARWAGIQDMGVGYAGMKDRHAVTRQRFSVHFPKRVAPDLAGLVSDDLRVLDSTWHNRKLPRGALKGNRFILRLRDVVGDDAAMDARLESIASNGLPNYFGNQRFGREGDNVEAARRMFAGQRVHRDQRSIYLSAARSEMFNAALAARVLRGDWARGGEGEVWMLDGSQSVFGPEPASDEIQSRAARQDIHPTGPMWGLGELRSQGDVRAAEEEALAPFADLRAGLEAAGMKQERRALRVRVADLRWQRPEPGQLLIEFTLPAGAYATGLLEALGDVAEPGRGVRPDDAGTCAGEPAA